MKQYEITGKNVEAAIEQGLLDLGLSREDVDIKIVDAGGMFKKAKVILEYESTEEEKIIEEAKPVAEEKPAIEKKKESKKVAEKIEEENNGQNEKTTIVKNVDEKAKRPVVKNEALENKITDFLTKLVELYGLKGEVKYEYNDLGLEFSVDGEDVGKLIGYRGENLNAIQHLINSLKTREELSTKLFFNVENYKEKREQILTALANKMAKKALANHRDLHLEAMTPNERRIIHTALQEIEGIYTESYGEGNNRHIVIKVKD